MNPLGALALGSVALLVFGVGAFAWGMKQLSQAEASC